MLTGIASVVLFAVIALFLLAKFVAVSAALLTFGAIVGFIAAVVLVIVGVVALANRG